MNKILTIAFFVCAAVAPAFAQAGIRAVDFENFTYKIAGLSGEGFENYTVKDGKFSRESEDDRVYFAVTHVVYGDLDADGKEEAVVTVILNTGGSGNFTSGYVFRMKNGKPAVMTTFEGGDRAYGGIYDVAVEGGRLVLEQYEPGPDGGACCPEFIVKSRFLWNGTKLVETGKAEKRELYPTERVAFKKGTTMSIFTARFEKYGRKRYVVGARKGQTLLVSSGVEPAETLSYEIIRGDATVEKTPNGIVVKLNQTGDFVIEIANESENEATASITIEIN